MLCLRDVTDFEAAKRYGASDCAYAAATTPQPRRLSTELQASRYLDACLGSVRLYSRRSLTQNSQNRDSITQQSHGVSGSCGQADYQREHFGDAWG